MNFEKSPRALLRDRSKVLLNSSRALEVAQKKGYGVKDDESGE